MKISDAICELLAIMDLNKPYTSSNLYELYKTIGDAPELTYDQFRRQFSKENTTFVYNRKCQWWHFPSISDYTEEETMEEDVPKKAGKETNEFEVMFRNVVKETAEEFASQITAEMLQEILTPVVQMAVKKEFDEKVVPAIKQNLEASVDSKVVEASSHIDSILSEAISDERIRSIVVSIFHGLE